jgi:hypothetical protein
LELTDRKTKLFPKFFITIWRIIMKVKSNIRAGRKSGTAAPSTDSTSVSTPDSAPVYVAPIGRCSGV